MGWVKETWPGCVAPRWPEGSVERFGEARELKEEAGGALRSRLHEETRKGAICSGAAELAVMAEIS